MMSQAGPVDDALPVGDPLWSEGAPLPVGRPHGPGAGGPPLGGGRAGTGSRREGWDGLRRSRWGAAGR